MGKILALLLGPSPNYEPRPIRTHGSKGHHGLCMHFYTYGQSLRPEPRLSHPTIFRVNCAQLKPPADHICEGNTGLDRKVADSFFSYSANETRFQEALDQVQRYLDKHDDHIGCVAIMVSCYWGVHRSVAMAERLATVVEKWTGLSVHCRHLDLGKGIERQQRAKRQKMLRSIERFWPQSGGQVVVRRTVPVTSAPR